LHKQLKHLFHHQHVIIVIISIAAIIFNYRVFQKTDTRVYFGNNFSIYAPILIIFFTDTRNLWHIEIKLRLPPHLYFVTTLPNKTNTAANINAINV